MPTYEYECRACGYSFERVQNMSDDPVRECPRCGQSVRRLIFGGSGVIFKGSGFYVNDSRGKNPATPSAAKPTSSTPETGAASEPKKAETASTGTQAQSGSAPAKETA